MAAVQDGHFEVYGQTCKVTLGKKQPSAPQEGAPSTQLGIFKLPKTVNQRTMEELLRTYEGFKEVTLATNSKDGQFLGYAFATFETVEHATVARSILQGMPLGDKPIDARFSNKKH
uniref:RRM domain-containing protein n=1 Tax=Eutreptiella gymnastica TaxID=73025 RepID=A0A6U8C573_9EUGL|mmetsp:Transcript_22951/g.41329  ORF Transcript_22951/g.41329 Transcript_22951/m.41329 type:complete len:116 (+) Transcript_22951:404-751(+)